MSKPKQTTNDMDLGAGLQTRLTDDLVQPSSARGVMNVEFSEYPFQATSRKGFVNWGSTGGSGVMNLLRKWYTSDSTKTDYFIAHRGTSLHRALSTGSAFTSVKTGMANAIDDSAAWDDNAYIVNGTDAVRSSDGGTWFNMGNRAPSATPTLAAVGVGSATGTYYGAYSLVFGGFGEGPPSAITSAGVVVANQKIRFSALSTGVTGVTRRRFYVSSHSAPGTVYRVGSDGGAGTTFTTAAFTEDDLLDAAEVGLAPFPTCDRICFHAGRMFGVPVADKGQIVVSRAFRPDVYDALDNINDVRDSDGARISALVSLSNEILLVFTETGVWALRGASPATWRLERIYEVGMPRGAFRSAVVINGRCFWKSRRHIYSTAGYRADIQTMSLPIERTVDTIALDDTSISQWCAVDYRPKNWYILFANAGSATEGVLSDSDHADLSFMPFVGPIQGGVGAWSTQNTAFSGRLCLVYDYQNSSLGHEIWTVFNIAAISATSLNGRGDTGLVHFAHPTTNTQIIRQFERTGTTYADNTTAISSKVRYAWKADGDFARDKRWRRTYLQGKMIGGTGTVYSGVSANLAASTWVESVAMSTGADVYRVVLPTDMHSEHHSYYMGFSSGTARMLIESLSEEFKMRVQRI